MLLAIDGDIIGCAVNVEFNATRDLLSAACKADGAYGSSLPGTINATISGDGLYQPDSTVPALSLLALLMNGTEVDFSFGTNQSGDQVITGKAYATSYTQSGPEGDFATYAFEFAVNGPFYVTTLASPY